MVREHGHENLPNINYIQGLQDGFSKLTGLLALFVDPQGRHLSKPSMQQELYHFIRSTSRGERLVRRFTGRLARTGTTGGTRLFRDSAGGLVVGVIPIVYEGVHLASWMMGYFENGASCRDTLCRYARVLGVDEERFCAYIGALPAVSADDFARSFSLMEVMADTMMDLVQSNYTKECTNKNLLKLTNKLNSTAQMLSKFTNSADVGMFVTDFHTGTILQANDYFYAFTGCKSKELDGERCWKVGGGRDVGGFCPDCPRETLLDKLGRPARQVTWERHLEEENRWLRVTNQAIYWVNGRLAHMVTFVDITQNKLMQQQLSQLAYYDRNLALPNGLKLEKDMGAMTAREREGMSLICFNIISLRSVNDVYSREIGDALLAEMVRWIQEQFSAQGCLYRIGGDEFCLALKGDSQAVCRAQAEQLNARFEFPWVFQREGEEIHIFCNISIGAIHPVDDRHIAEGLLNMLGRILSIARKGGGLVVYDEAMDQAYTHSQRLAQSLKTCIKEDMRGFDVFYQPIVDAGSGRWLAVEALCRWESPLCGLVSPRDFIPEAEQMGLIGPIGRWVMEQAVHRCSELGLHRQESFYVNVNISPLQLNDDGLLEWVTNLLQRYHYPPDRLGLEITESTEHIFNSRAKAAMKRLREMGVRVALDDFGTGYSSLNSLKQLPVTTIKTDGSFLENIADDYYLQDLIHMTVRLAHSAHKHVIAEGVETQGQMQILQKNGVDYMQGYLFSHPLNGKQLADFVQAGAFDQGEVDPAGEEEDVCRMHFLTVDDMHGIFDALDFPVYVTNGRDHCVAYANKAAKQFLANQQGGPEGPYAQESARDGFLCKTVTVSGGKQYTLYYGRGQCSNPWKRTWES